ncbi:hypothetical protein GCM10028809_59560 [Spirosoma gilvum]
MAKEYIAGKRKTNYHPGKLLVLSIALLAVVITKTNYLTSTSTNTLKITAIIQTYSNWSFSLGILAIVISVFSCFSWKYSYNLTEYVILSMYCHFVILMIRVISLVPGFWVDHALWIDFQKQYAPLYTNLADLVILARAYGQFFGLTFKNDWVRFLGALVVYMLVKKYIILAYVWLIVQLYVADLIH